MWPESGIRAGNWTPAARESEAAPSVLEQGVRGKGAEIHDASSVSRPAQAEPAPAL